jgi:hypothetical protein
MGSFAKGYAVVQRFSYSVAVVARLWWIDGVVALFAVVDGGQVAERQKIGEWVKVLLTPCSALFIVLLKSCSRVLFWREG